MTDEQTTQPLTDAELSALRDYIERTNHVDNLRGDARRLLAEVDRLRAELSGVRTALINAHEAGMSLGQEVERLNLEVVQVQSGAQIAMDAGVAALQEVGRLEKKRDQLKEINDRMAEDRLRIIDERNRFKWMVEAARKALFEDAALSDNHRLTRLTSILGTGME